MARKSSCAMPKASTSMRRAECRVLVETSDAKDCLEDLVVRENNIEMDPHETGGGVLVYVTQHWHNHLVLVNTVMSRRIP